MWNVSVAGTLPAWCRLQAAASVAWPQSGTSMVGVNHRKWYVVGESVGCTNAVSLRFISAAMACLCVGAVVQTICLTEAHTVLRPSFACPLAVGTPLQGFLRMDDQQTHQPVAECCLMPSGVRCRPIATWYIGTEDTMMNTMLYTRITKIIRRIITKQSARAPLPRHPHRAPPLPHLQPA